VSKHDFKTITLYMNAYEVHMDLQPWENGLNFKKQIGPFKSGGFQNEIQI
jgi:hypothetical protein